MTQDRNLIHHLNTQQRKRDEEKLRKKHNYEMNLRKLSNNTSFNRPPDMRSAYERVKEKDHITHDEDYLRVTGNLKYDV